MEYTINKEFKKYTVEGISLLFILLFVYAAVSKLLDFENFEVQLGQSPLLSAFAVWTAWLVPIVELFIAFSLSVPYLRYFGFIVTIILMTMFTAYIYIILNYSSFIPCSCGGILEKMNWETHLIFNIVFLILSVSAFIFECQLKDKKRIFTPLVIVPLSVIIGSIVVIILFLSSEEIMHYKNPFLRRYDRRAVSFEGSKDLKFNSYYFSGFAHGYVYMGNYSTPLRIFLLDSSLNFEKAYKIILETPKISFRSIKISVTEKQFYLMDGTVPCVYFGSTANWRTTGNLEGIPRFTAGQPIDKSSFIFRNNNGRNLANIIGLYNAEKQNKIHYSQNLLQKQIDGIFDTDGMLHYDNETQKMVYVYFYRNQFITADKNINLIRRGNTIDTISKAQIKVALLREGTRKKMAVPPLVVNAKSAVSNNLLFIESKIRGHRENEEIWKYASIIDVYNLENNSYVLSFPVFGNGSDKLHSFIVTNTHFYAIIGTRLTVYRFNSILRKEMRKTATDL